jgi:hypothetical protein
MAFIEVSAEVGSRGHDRSTSSVGVKSAFPIHGSKALTTGDGKCWFSTIAACLTGSCGCAIIAGRWAMPCFQRRDRMEVQAVAMQDVGSRATGSHRGAGRWEAAYLRLISGGAIGLERGIAQSRCAGARSQLSHGVAKEIIVPYLRGNGDDGRQFFHPFSPITVQSLASVRAVKSR